MTRKSALTIILIAGYLLAACNFPLLSQPAEEPNALATAVAQTLQAMASQPLPTQQPASQQPTTSAGLPTVTPPLPIVAFTVQAPATATPQPCNKALFLSETIPDDTVYAPGDAFKKSWTFKNVGTCTWNTNYKLVFSGGDAMGGPASVQLAKSVAPDGQIAVEVPLKAPATAGSYTGTWKLQAEDGTQFGQVTVRIKVKSEAFSVSSVYTNLSDVIPAACPYTYSIDISIVSSAAGKVTYQTETSGGAVSSLKSLTFDAAGTEVEDFTWSGLGVGGAATDYWLKVYVQQPNNQTFGPFNFKVTCP